MIRRIVIAVLFVFATGAATAAVDWVWLHGLRSYFGFLERNTGFWALAVVCSELFFILAAMYKMTQWPLLHRWLMASSWLLPSYLFTAYLCRGLSADPKGIHSLERFYVWQTAMILHAQQIHAARCIPLLTLAVVMVTAAWWLKGGFGRNSPRSPACGITDLRNANVN